MNIDYSTYQFSEKFPKKTAVLRRLNGFSELGVYTKIESVPDTL